MTIQAYIKFKTISEDDYKVEFSRSWQILKFDGINKVH